MVQVIITEFGYMVLPVFSYMSDFIQWQDSDQANDDLFVREFRTRVQAERASERLGYEVLQQNAVSSDYLAV